MYQHEIAFPLDSLKAELEVSPELNMTVIKEIHQDSKGIVLELHPKSFSQKAFVENQINLQDNTVTLSGTLATLLSDILQHKSIEILIKEFMEQHLLNFFEARGILQHYLQRLQKSGLININTPN